MSDEMLDAILAQIGRSPEEHLAWWTQNYREEYERWWILEDTLNESPELWPRHGSNPPRGS